LFSYLITLLFSYLTPFIPYFFKGEGNWLYKKGRSLSSTPFTLEVEHTGVLEGYFFKEEFMDIWI